MSTDAFAQHPLVKPWIESMANRKGGKPLKSMRGRITTFKKLCELLRCEPDYFLAPQDTQEILKHVARIMQDLMPTSKAGQYPTGRAPTPMPSFIALSGPLETFGFSWRRFPSRTVRGYVPKDLRTRRQVSDVQLSDDQIEKGIEYIKGKHGIDSDIYRVFVLGSRAAARQAAIMGAKIDNYEGKPPKRARAS